MAGETDPRQSDVKPPGGLPGGQTRPPVVEALIRMPDVIVDFDVDGDGLHVVVKNIGAGPAHRVRVAFDPEFRGAGGTVIGELAVFHRLEFLAPGRALIAFVDVLPSFFGRGEPDVVTATATFHDDRGRAYRRRVRHDLGIYRDLPRGRRSGT